MQHLPLAVGPQSPDHWTTRNSQDHLPLTVTEVSQTVCAVQVVLPEGLVLGGFLPGRQRLTVYSESGWCADEADSPFEKPGSVPEYRSTESWGHCLSYFLTPFILVKSAMKHVLFLPFLLCAH